MRTHVVECPIDSVLAVNDHQGGIEHFDIRDEIVAGFRRLQDIAHIEPFAAKHRLAFAVEIFGGGIALDIDRIAPLIGSFVVGDVLLRKKKRQ